MPHDDVRETEIDEDLSDDARPHPWGEMAVVADPDADDDEEPPTLREPRHDEWDDEDSTPQQTL